MIKKIKTVCAVLFIFIVANLVFWPAISFADEPPTLKDSNCAPMKLSQVGPLKGEACRKNPNECLDVNNDGKYDNKDLSSRDDTKCAALGSKKIALAKNPIVTWLNGIVNVLAGLVGVVVVGTIILGGIQYAAAGDKAEAVSAAKQRIINVLIALFAFLFIYAFLQWLVPGGIF